MYIIYGVRDRREEGEERITVVCDFLEVFLEDLPRFLLDGQVDFRIDLLSGQHQ